MTRTVALVSLAALIWLVGSTWYYDCAIKRVCGPDDAPVVVTDQTVMQVGEPIALQQEPDAVAEPDAPVVLEAPLAPTPLPRLTVHFDQKSAALVAPADADATLEAIKAQVAQGARLVVTGHSDSRGERQRIAIVSQQRADALRAWLIVHGMPPEAIARAESREDREPIADNATAEGRAENRRAVAQIIRE